MPKKKRVASQINILGGHFARDAANDKVHEAAGEFLVRVDLRLGDAVLMVQRKIRRNPE
jgi:hypothetical protein